MPAFTAQGIVRAFNDKLPENNRFSWHTSGNVLILGMGLFRGNSLCLCPNNF
ncbi:hypothetical protein MDMS009_107 [Methylophaga thiooxydans DMS010]|uniref:Uncharacterized protein n=1 Tax=Methylophaga thiooxydans DMS010 TaxID=637616 RepID=C0N244_9GAMM|nr:hypothetical protein MDMS009_107 [Methylophaga thiooxydans DMS010]